MVTLKNMKRALLKSWSRIVTDHFKHKKTILKKLIALSMPSAAMAHGPKKHLTHIAAPKHWRLDKLTGVFVPHPSTSLHELRECLPLIVFLRKRLTCALTGDEVKKICVQQFIKIAGKV